MGMTVWSITVSGIELVVVTNKFFFIDLFQNLLE
jgi:hypothetical protein